jgi:hypothetical protein
MAFKLCLTVMNALKPNSSAALDLLATMEAFDKYNNLRDAIFQHHKEESKVVSNNERDPILITIRDRDGHPMLVRVSVSGLTVDPMLIDTVQCEHGRCPDFASSIPEGKRQGCVTRMTIYGGLL